MLRMGYFAATEAPLAPPPVIINRGTYQTSANSSTYTYSNAPLGPDEPGRGTLVTVSVGGDGRDIGTVTVGGQVAQEIVQGGFINGTFSVGIYYVEVSGTNATISATVTGSAGSRATIEVCSITGHNPVPFDTGQVDGSSSSSSASVTLDLPANGVALAYDAMNSNATWTWPNSTRLFNNTVGGETGSSSAATRTVTDPSPNTTINCTTSASNQHAIIAASFGPQ